MQGWIYQKLYVSLISVPIALRIEISFDHLGEKT